MNGKINLVVIVCSLSIASVALAQFEIIINAPPTVVGANESIGSNTQLNVFEDGLVGFSFDAGSFDAPNENLEVNVFGGMIGSLFDANDGSTINISGGIVGIRFDANEGSMVNISGGNIGSQFDAHDGSAVNISGGTIGTSFDAHSGSQVNISGGSVGALFTARSGSTANLSGGTFGRDFRVFPSSDVAFIGGEFLRNGIPAPDNVSLGINHVMSGTLEDGTVFIFSRHNAGIFSDELFGVELQETSLPPADKTPMFIDDPDDPVPPGLRAGQSLTVSGTAILGRDFAAVGAELNIDGGSIGGGLEFTDCDVMVAGGVFGGGIDVYRDSVLYLFGGTVGNVLSAFDGSSVHIFGGNVGESFRANEGSFVNISGGIFGQDFDNQDGSEVTFSGGEFFFNGSPLVDAKSVTLASGDVITGTFEDGSVFVFARSVGDFLTGVAFLKTSVPPIEFETIVVDKPGDPVPPGLRAGQELTLRGIGSIGDNFAAVGAMLNVEGGTIGNGLEVVDTVVDFSDGSVGSDFTVHTGSVVNITGGNIGSSLFADSGSTINISGGTVGSFFDSIEGSEVNITGGNFGNRFEVRSNVNISGGSFGDDFRAFSESNVTIDGGSFGVDFEARNGSTVAVAGGVFGRGFTADIGSDVAFIGGEFQLNGVPIVESESVSLETGDALSGTLASGAVFVFRSFFDNLNSVELQAAELPPVNPNEQVIDDPNDFVPPGLRADESLRLLGSGAIGENFAAVGAVLSLESGVVGQGLEVANTEVVVSGGFIDSGFDALVDSHLEISGGKIASCSLRDSVAEISGGNVSSLFMSNSLANISGGTVGLFASGRNLINLSGGVIAERSRVLSDITLNMTGGTVGSDFQVFISTMNLFSGTIGSGLTSIAGKLNIFGGTIGNPVSIHSAGEFNLYGNEFFLDGIPIAMEGANQPILIQDRDVTLAGTLVDGSSFSIDLNSTSSDDNDFFDPATTLTVTFVASGVAGDVNGDSVVNLSDVAPFVDLITSGNYQFEGDIHQDGAVNLLDVAPFVELLTE